MSKKNRFGPKGDWNRKFHPGKVKKADLDDDLGIIFDMAAEIHAQDKSLFGELFDQISSQPSLVKKSASVTFVPAAQKSPQELLLSGEINDFKNSIAAAFSIPKEFIFGADEDPPVVLCKGCDPTLLQADVEWCEICYVAGINPCGEIPMDGPPTDEIDFATLTPEVFAKMTSSQRGSMVGKIMKAVGKYSLNGLDVPKELLDAVQAMALAATTHLDASPENDELQNKIKIPKYDIKFVKDKPGAGLIPCGPVTPTPMPYPKSGLWGNLSAHDLISVQPMTNPAGAKFHFDYKYAEDAESEGVVVEDEGLLLASLGYSDGDIKKILADKAEAKKKEWQDSLPGLSDIKLTKTEVTVHPDKKLKAKWGVEPVEDFNSPDSIQSEADLIGEWLEDTGVTPTVLPNPTDFDEDTLAAFAEAKLNKQKVALLVKDWRKVHPGQSLPPFCKKHSDYGAMMFGEILVHCDNGNGTLTLVTGVVVPHSSEGVQIIVEKSLASSGGVGLSDMGEALADVVNSSLDLPPLKAIDYFLAIGVSGSDAPTYLPQGCYIGAGTKNIVWGVPGSQHAVTVAAIHENHFTLVTGVNVPIKPPIGPKPIFMDADGQKPIFAPYIPVESTPTLELKTANAKYAKKTLNPAHYGVVPLSKGKTQTAVAAKMTIKGVSQSMIFFDAQTGTEYYIDPVTGDLHEVTRVVTNEDTLTVTVIPNSKSTFFPVSPLDVKNGTLPFSIKMAMKAKAVLEAKIAQETEEMADFKELMGAPLKDKTSSTDQYSPIPKPIVYRKKLLGVTVEHIQSELLPDGESFQYYKDVVTGDLHKIVEASSGWATSKDDAKTWVIVEENPEATAPPTHPLLHKLNTKKKVNGDVASLEAEEHVDENGDLTVKWAPKAKMVTHTASFKNNEKPENPDDFMYAMEQAQADRIQAKLDATPPWEQALDLLHDMD